MKIPKIGSVSFNQYLNIKRHFLKRAIRGLEEIKKRHNKLDDDYIEAHEMLKFQKKELKDVDCMLRYEKLSIHSCKETK